jgi:Rho GDP-dissociation inhibitor
MDGAFPSGGGVAESPPDFDEEDDEKFKKPKQIDLQTMVSKDSDDESLRKYKASLLGDTSVVAADVEIRRVVIHALRISVAGRPDIVLPLDTPDKVKAVATSVIVVKEGLAFNTTIVFSVHHDVVLGLRFAQKVNTWIGITVDSMNQMIGSYPPKSEPYEFAFPPGEWPSGLLGRGKYTAKVRYIDYFTMLEKSNVVGCFCVCNTRCVCV